MDDQRDYAEEAFNAELLRNPEGLTEDDFEQLVSEGHPAARGGGHEVLDKLRDRSEPIPGRDGWRRTEDGRTFYSAAWIGLRA